MAQARHEHKQAYLEVNDGIAKATVCVHPDVPRPRCKHCDNPSVFTIMYRGGKGGIADALMKRCQLDIANTLLKSERNWLCLSCWPKFERQVVHIESAGGK